MQIVDLTAAAEPMGLPSSRAQARCTHYIYGDQRHFSRNNNIIIRTCFVIVAIQCTGILWSATVFFFYFHLLLLLFSHRPVDYIRTMTFFHELDLGLRAPRSELMRCRVERVRSDTVRGQSLYVFPRNLIARSIEL